MTLGVPVYDVVGQGRQGQPGVTIIAEFTGISKSYDVDGGQIYRFDSEKTCFVKFGEDPEATANDIRVLQDRLEYFTPIVDCKVAVIQKNTAGTLRITPMLKTL